MFHSSNPSLFGRPGGVLADARALESSIAALRSLGGPPEIAAISDRASRVQRALSDFSAHLSLYFDAEEGSGYFAAIRAQDAGFGSRVTELEEAHEGLRRSISSARRKARTSSDADGVGLTRHIADIIRRFEAHEVLEQELLQDFFLA